MMYRKIIILGIIFTWFFFGISINNSYAQQTFSEDDFSAISLSAKLCDDITWWTNENIISIEPGKEKELCLTASNGWSKTMKIVYGFSKWTTSQAWDAVCDGDMSTWNTFSILLPWTHERSIILTPNTNQIIKEKIVIPPGITWPQIWCLAYKWWAQYDLWWMFSLVVRKIENLIIVVWWETNVNKTIKTLDTVWGVFSTNKKIKIQVDKDNNGSLSVIIKNEWNISQNITITWKIYNALGFQKDFIMDKKQINPGIESEFKTDIGILPSYKWFFTVKLNVKGDPIFLFPVSNEKSKEPIYISEQGKIFVFAWMRIIILIVALFIIFKLFVHKRIQKI